MVALNRRDFFRTGGVITAGVALWPACTTKMLEEASYRFFTNDEAMSMIALCEQIIPGDDHFGGATDAGVILYIDRQLSGAFKEDAPVYREHLKLLQTHCKNEFGKAFQKLFSDEQIDVMERMESNTIGAATWERPANFFRLIRSHTMQGFYGSPIHGGNKDYLSFDMLGLEYPLNIGQNRYRKPLHEL